MTQIHEQTFYLIVTEHLGQHSELKVLHIILVHS